MEPTAVAPGTADDRLDQALRAARRRYVESRPRTQALHAGAREVLPGGNTRTVLYHGPFPLRVVRGWDSVLEDADGHHYVDLLGNYSAALYGHAHPVLVAAVTTALREGVGPGRTPCTRSPWRARSASASPPSSRSGSPTPAPRPT